MLRDTPTQLALLTRSLHEENWNISHTYSHLQLDTPRFVSAMLNCTGSSDVSLPVPLQSSKLQAAQLSAASLGYPWCCTASVEGASAAGQWLWLWSSCGGWCLEVFLEGSQEEWVLPQANKHPHPNFPGRAWLSCLQRNTSRQAFQIHLFLPIP